jgi:triacylglycerol esterase/lipase EstA (alpha/beta hydrolase family)
MVPALLGLAGVLALAAPTGASQYPVPYNFSAGVLAAALTPGAPPPGSNDWSCRPSAAHPEPVILVHGLAANMTDNWQTISPLLANNGYCVFALTYGTNPDFPFPLDQIGGLAPLEESAQTIGDFVDQVLAATGATKVNIVGHSEGATMPDYYVKFLGGAAKVDHYVGIAPVYHGTTLYGLSSYVTALASIFPPGAQAVGQFCASCQEFLAGSPFVTALNAGGAAVAGVTYTNIVTRYDELVIPYTSGFLAGSNVVNIVVQDQCALDFADHVAMAADHIVGQDVLNALDPAHARAPRCSLVLYGVGG